MDFAGKMHRTLAVNRIPTGWIGRTVKLGVKTDLPHRIFNGMADQSTCCLPRRPTGRPANDLHLGNLPLFNYHRKFRGAEMLSIIAKANLPWKPTSSGRGKQTFAGYFFA